VLPLDTRHAAAERGLRAHFFELLDLLFDGHGKEPRITNMLDGMALASPSWWPHASRTIYGTTSRHRANSAGARSG
jgi:hypothetical protein